MIKLSGYIREIDYITLLEYMWPYGEEWLKKKGGGFYDIMAKVFSKDKKPRNFSKGLVSAIPKKTKMIAWLLQNNEEILLEYLDGFLRGRNIFLQMISLNIGSIERRGETMLKLEITIDKIDYERTIESLLPGFIRKLAEKGDERSKIGRLMLGFDELPLQMVKGALGAVPPEKRDDLMASILEEYREQIMDLINDIMVQNDIKGTISDLHFNSRGKTLLL